MSEFEGRPKLKKKEVLVDFLKESIRFVSFFLIIGMLVILVFNAKDSRQTRTTLIDCVTPTGVCASESQKRTAEVLSLLIKDNAKTRAVVIAAVACARLPENNTFAKVQECVESNVGYRQ